MKTTSPKVSQLAPEQILRAADYMELVWQEQGSEEEKAALAQFHADGPELGRLIGEFGALLLSDYLTVVPDEHANCESAYITGKLMTVASRYLKRWCLASGAGAHTAWIAAGFLIECMQEVDQVHQFLADIRRDTRARHGAAAARAEREARAEGTTRATAPGGRDGGARVWTGAPHGALSCGRGNALPHPVGAPSEMPPT
jgi:hypothetical protein